MDIEIRTTPHESQRYDTVGDWYEVLMAAEKREVLHISVSEMADPDHVFLVGLHELVEAWLCKRRGITTAQVDAWDMAWKADGEPGDHPDAPYHREHAFASRVERLMADELGVDWDAYEATLNEVGK